MSPQTKGTLSVLTVGDENAIPATGNVTNSSSQQKDLNVPDVLPIKGGKGNIKPKSVVEPVVNDTYSFVCYNDNSNLQYYNKVPFFGTFFDVQGSETQMIYPASELSELAAGDTITGFRFFAYNIPSAMTTTTFEVRVGNTTTSTVTSANAMISNRSSLTPVYQGQLTEGSTYATILFDTPIVYQGNNLMVDIYVTSAGGYSNSCYWICDNRSTSGVSYYYCNDSQYSSNSNYNGPSTYLPSMVMWYKHPTTVEVSPRDIVVKDEAFFDGIEYAWPYNADPSEQTTSKLSETATDPDQMIAMLREIYMNKSIPGNLNRGYAYDGSPETRNNDVYYPGVGTILLNNSSAYTNINSYEFDEDGLGWGIPGEMDQVSSGAVGLTSGSSLTAYFATAKQDTYRPNEEGLTLLLVEMKDTYVDGSNNTIANQTFANEYERLRAYFANTVRSIKVVTEARRTGDGFASGTLFKIDCDKMNKFFLLAKGQLHLDHQSTWYFRRFSDVTQDLYANDISLPPSYIYLNSSNNQYWDNNSGPLFYHMFEQFSPSMPSDTIGALDLYQNMTTNMESFPVIHDCLGVTVMNHQFMMYGTDSGDDDCQDIHDLMFFIPDYRMLTSDRRDPSIYLQEYLNYHTQHQPQMSLFVIKQNPITGEQIDGQETYKLHLTWNSNLLDFLPGTDGQYNLYRVIINPDGTKTYQKIGNFNPNTFEYYDNVPMQHNGQQVTYVVQGQDVDEFLDLQMSNEESYIIPGLDRAEQLRIDLNSDYYFSRYDAADQTNNYSNSLIANNTVGTNVKPQYLENGSQFKFWRATVDEQTGNVVTPANPFVVAEVSNWNASTGGTLTYKDWDDQTNFSSKPYGHGYHANPATSTISVSNGEVVFDGLKLYDNFSVSVANNEHPSQYVYYVTLHTSVPFELGTNNVPDIATWQNGKTFAYFEAYTNWTDVRAWAWDTNNNDYNYTGGNWPGQVMELVGTHGSNYVYRWAIPQGNGAPNKIIFNWNDNGRQQTGNLDFANGGYYTTSGLVSVINTSQDARSNTVSVPVYKTEMTMNPISADVVENDVTHATPATTKFQLDAQYSSRSEILGYYIYRWADGETAATARSIYESNGDDSSPQGQAGNQGTYYSVAMNTDYTAQTDNFGSNFDPVTASFEDNYMIDEAEEGDTYTYAPVVELFAPIQAVELPSGVDRSDYNTYGGPQQMTAGGIVNVDVLKPAQSDYTWTANGKEYTYYNVYLDVTKLDIPDGYEIAKVRAWRKIDSQYLGEQEGQGYEGRLQLDANGEYKFIEQASCAEGDELGNNGANASVHAGTFGAVKLNSGESIPMEFVVRVYFTKSVSGSKAADPNGDYYIAEYTISDALTSEIPTSIFGVESYRNVESVKYINAAGVESDTPFKGVNIVVTRYSDGSMTTTKILK